MLINVIPGIAAARVVSTEISSGKFLEIIAIFPENIYTENFPPVQTFQITVCLLTSSLSIGFCSTSAL